MAQHTSSEREQRVNPWMVLVTVMIASFLGRLDGTIVNLALPDIIKDFGITVSQAGWISTAYIIANAIFVPIFGKLGDLMGRKPLYLAGIIGFTISSMFAGLAWNLGSMVVFRIFQAIAVSIDYPIALSIIAYTFQDKAKRAQAMGLWSAIFAVSAVFGPLIGGPLIDNFSWRSVFYINLPLGLMGTYMAWRYIQEPVKHIKGMQHFDVVGSVLLGIFLAALVLVLDQGQAWGWTSVKSILSYGVSAIAFVGFLVVEYRAKEPVVDLKLFKIPTFSAAIVTSFISFMGLMGGMFTLPIFIQTYMGYSVTQTGLLFIPMAIGMMVSAPLGSKLSQTIPPRYLVAFGMFWAALIMYFFTVIDIKWVSWDIAWRMFAFAFGIGLGMAPITSAATSSVPLHEVGIASSVLALARNVAGAFGVAIFATIFSDAVTSGLFDIQRFSVIHSANPSIIQEYMSLMVTKANVHAFSHVYWVAMLFMIFGGVSALFVREAEVTDDRKAVLEEHPVEM